MADPAPFGMRDLADPVLKVVPMPETGPAGTDILDRVSDPFPSVTVALPVLNEAAYIEGCLRAVVEQTYPHIVEILVVDGGSEDATCQIASRFPGVRIIENPG